MFTNETITADELKALSHDVVSEYHRDEMDEPYKGAGYCACWLCQEVAPSLMAAATTIELLEAENATLRAENNKLRFLNAVAEKAFDEGGATLDRASDKIESLLAELNARADVIKLMRSREEAYDNRIERLKAENAALRARIDDCAAALMADAEGR